jgi:hypothetical protein
MFRAIYGWKNNQAIPPTYICLVSIISNLKRVGLTPNDRVIIAVDSPKGSWRKEIDSNYKANRKEKREKEDINWKEVFSAFSTLIEQLETCTPFHVIIIDKMEADDIIAYGCKKIKNSDHVIISTDSDYEQLYIFPNVKIFSPKSKKYKIVKNPYSLLLQKIKKETADNLISPILSKEDYEKRKKIVSLIKLPEEIEQIISPHLEFLPDKDWDIDNLPFETLRERFINIYDLSTITINKPKKRKPKPINQITL